MSLQKLQSPVTYNCKCDLFCNHCNSFPIARGAGFCLELRSSARESIPRRRQPATRIAQPQRGARSLVPARSIAHVKKKRRIKDECTLVTSYSLKEEIGFILFFLLNVVRGFFQGTIFPFDYYFKKIFSFQYFRIDYSIFLLCTFSP